jgi:hypothetical protein
MLLGVMARSGRRTSVRAGCIGVCRADRVPDLERATEPCQLSALQYAYEGRIGTAVSATCRVQSIFRGVQASCWTAHQMYLD